MCFDTNASYLLSLQCYSLIKNKLSKHFLFLAIMLWNWLQEQLLKRLHLAHPVNEVLIFKRFKYQWEILDHGNFQTSSDPSVEYLVAPSYSDVLLISHTQLKSNRAEMNIKSLLNYLSHYLEVSQLAEYNFKCQALCTMSN